MSEGKGILSGLRRLKHIEIVALLIGVGLVLAFIVLPYTEGNGARDAPAMAQATAAPQGMEARLGAVLGMIDGAGAVEVFVTWEPDDSAVRGVIIVAEGADDLSVQMALRRAARAALDISAQQVDVFAMYREEAIEYDE